MEGISKRRTIRLPEYDYSNPGFYFITICTENRRLLFGQIKNNQMELNILGKIVRQAWLNIENYNQNIKLDEFIIMPNHIHGLIIIKDNKINIKNKNILTIGINNQNIVSAVGAIHELPLREQQIKKKKYRQTRRQMLLPKMIGKFKMNSAKQINNILKTIGKPVWQRNYYERIVRDNDELSNIIEYIQYNPDKWAQDRNNLQNNCF